MRRSTHGFALIAVLVALSILLALAVPFLISMDYGDAVARSLADEKHVEMASASARDLVLQQAALTHESFDEDSAADGPEEFPDQLALPQAFAGLADDGRSRQLLSAETEDLQRRINLNSASPLTLANLLDLSARTVEDHEADFGELVVSSTSSFPEPGVLLVDREVIRYESIDGNKFVGLERGLMADLGYEVDDHAVAADTLVLDFRVVLAVMHGIYHDPEDRRDAWRPLRSVDDLARLHELGFGSFSAEEMDVLRASLTVGSVRESATDWGPAERLFEPVEVGASPWEGRTLRVRNGANFGAGRIVRVRTLDGEQQEYALCVRLREVGAGSVNLPSPWAIDLLRPLSRSYPEIDTVVEPMLPHPVNVNTASETVLAALIEGVAQGARRGPHPVQRRPYSKREAVQLAREIRALRGDEDVAEMLMEAVFSGHEAEPFAGDEDFAKRFFKPRIDLADTRNRSRWLLLYRSLREGNVGSLDMVTGPVSFTSAPVVAYRAAAARLRGNQTAARVERQGTAVAMPNTGLDLILSSQEDFENRFRVDQRAPFYTTHPIHVGSHGPSGSVQTPPSRTTAHVLPMAFVDSGFGQPRFPGRDGNDSGFRLAPAHAPRDYGANGIRFANESMWSSQHPEGRDLDQEGPYEMFNDGPRTRTPAGGSTTPPTAPGGSRSHQPTFPFTADGGAVGRQAVSFWFMPRDTGDQMLFDLSADAAIRNRISVQIRGGDFVLEIYDEAGQDDDPAAQQEVETSPEITAGLWKVPLTDIDLQAGTWYHVNFAADGNRPGQLSLFIDGVPRGTPQLRTYLAAQIPAYTDPQRSFDPFWTERDRYLTIQVESTEGFPPRGTLRIGLELFEYTAITATSFLCDYSFGHRVHNSTGGRVSRMSLSEFVPSIPLDGEGRPTINLENLTAGANLRVAPPHDIGTAVELYGYSVALSRDSIVQVGEGRLTEAVGAFAVARVVNGVATAGDGQVIGLVPGPQGGGVVPRALGPGLTDEPINSIELGNPEVGDNPQPARAEIAAGFSPSGGYALLIQQASPFAAPAGARPIGGIELIRYSTRTGTELRGIVRGATLPPLAGQTQAGIFDGQVRQFVTEWKNYDPNGGTAQPGNLDTRWLTYVVPISLPVQGSLIDPQVIDRSEWLQLRPVGGDESLTEWVRYDYLDPNGGVMRTDLRSWVRTYTVLSLISAQTGAGGQVRTGYIGFQEQIELDYPQIGAARNSLGFRGDPFTGTSSHPQAANTQALQVHRVELDWGNYGAVSGRVGRNDRVALVAGSQADGSTRPAVEWHTVNWVARRFGSDVGPNGGPPGQNQELLGAYPFQLVAFKNRVSGLFIGPSQRNLLDDVRLKDRLVKFPSGELPTAAPEDGVFGATPQRDVPNLRGIVDELTVLQREAWPLLIDEPFSDTANQFIVRTDLRVTPEGDHVIGGDLTSEYPATGGLVLIDDEVIAYSDHAGGRFTVATNGRGLLGTEVRGHDEGAMVQFLDHVPAAILAGGLSESSPELVVQDMGNLPRHGGTVLVAGTELLHYCWSTGRQLLEMPVWFDPENESTRGRGLFRGRYGTNPVSAGAGEPVIWFPFRYWDRHHERADDPEMASFQVSWNLAPVYFDKLWWQDDDPDPLVDVHCVLRIDGGSSFADDPGEEPSLFLFEQGDPPNPIQRQGSRFEARFFTVYRPGAFDPQLFRAHSWKRAPTVRSMILDYQGESRLLTEEVTAR